MSTYNINPYTSYSGSLLVPTHFTYNEDLDSEASLLVKLYAVILLCSTMMGDISPVIHRLQLIKSMITLIVSLRHIHLK